MEHEYTIAGEFRKTLSACVKVKAKNREEAIHLATEEAFRLLENGELATFELRKEFVGPR